MNQDITCHCVIVAQILINVRTISFIQQISRSFT